MKRIDIIGQRFGKLVVIASAEKSKWHQLKWSCKCDCGNEKKVFGNDLKRGRTLSCGCANKHGMSNTRLYKSWQQMLDRCLNPNNKRYKDYGGRGITICDRWMKFENFHEDMGDRSSKNHSIDRINNEDGYSLENCKWSTRSQQQRNRRDTKYFTVFGVTELLLEWTKCAGTSSVYRWHKKGILEEKLLKRFPCLSLWN